MPRIHRSSITPLTGDFQYFHQNYRKLPTEKIRDNTLSLQEHTTLFCDALLYGSYNQRHYILTKKDGSPEEFKDPTDWPQRNITPLGVILILDVLNHPAKWRKHKIDFETLPNHHPMKKFYQEIILRLSTLLLKDDPKVQILKVLLYQSLKHQKNGKRKFTALSNLISESKMINSKIKFKKNTNDSKALRLEKNATYLSFDDQRIDINPEKNDGIINNVIETIAKEKIGDNEIDIAHFKNAILDLHYNLEEAIRHVKKLKNASILEDKAESKPTLLERDKLVAPGSSPSMSSAPVVTQLKYKV